MPELLHRKLPKFWDGPHAQILIFEWKFIFTYNPESEPVAFATTGPDREHTGPNKTAKYFLDTI